MCELLKDRVLIWFRNNQKPWELWSQFKKDLLELFLSQRCFEKLEIEIRSRTQRPQENFKEYLLALQDLMYHSNLNEEEKLEIIFRNSSPDYQWLIKRRDFKTLVDLVTLAAELEGIPNPKHPGRNELHRMLHDKQTLSTNTASPSKNQTHLSWEEEETNNYQSPSLEWYHWYGGYQKLRFTFFHKENTTKAGIYRDGHRSGTGRWVEETHSTAVQVPVTFGILTKNQEFLVLRDAIESVVLGLVFLRIFGTTILCAGLSTKGGSEAQELPDDDEPGNQVRKHNIVS